ncbi:MAG: hypothetical protein RSD88_03760 [Anaerovoracaceae bacterium]
MKENLLESLAESLDCDYISNLRYVTDFSLWENILSKIEVGQYPLTEWTEVIRYISENDDKEISDEISARKELEKILKDKRK